VKTIFLIYQPAAGEQFAEDILRAALGDTLRIADLHDQAEARHAPEFDYAGYGVFLRKGAVDAAFEAPKSDPVVMLLREPTARALEGYRADLAARGRSHSAEALQSYLASDALRTVDFWRKWSASPRSFALRGEALAGNARDTLAALFAAAGVNADEAALARGAGHADAAGRRDEVSLRTLEADPDFAKPYFAEYMNLLGEEAGYLGYPTWQDSKPAAGPVTTIYRAKRALAEGRFEDVLSTLGPFVAVNGAEPEVRALLGEALLEAGREVEGRRAIDGIIKAHPDYLDAFAILARHAYRLGLTVELRSLLREAMAREGGAAWTQAFLEKTKADLELLREFPQVKEPPISRDSVVSGFTWILGRPPESDAVVEVHRGLLDDDELRASLLRSQEFREFYERFTAGFEHAPEEGGEVTREDVLQAVRWLYGRALRSREEADDLLNAPSRAALRVRMVGTEEFAASYRAIVEHV